MIDPATLKRIVESSGLHFRQTPISFIFQCPRCSKRSKLYVRKRDGKFKCFSGSCQDEGFSGKPEFALAELLDRSVREVRELLYGVGVEEHSKLLLDVPELAGFEDEREEDDDILEEIQDLTPAFWSFDHHPIDHPHGAAGAAYLAGRGIPLAIAVKYQIRYAPLERRVCFPVLVDGRLVGWQGRIIVPHRHFNAATGKFSEIPKIVSENLADKAGKVWMFQDRLKGSRHAVVGEGPVDGIKAHFCGGNVAGMGKGISPAQVEILREYGIKRVYLALDPDAAHDTARLVNEMSDIEVMDMQIPLGIDLGAMHFREVVRHFDQAQRIQPGQVFIYVENKTYFS